LEGVVMISMDIRSMCQPEIESIMIETFKEPKYRGAQIFKWLHERNAQSYDEMTDLPMRLQKKLYELYPISPIKTITTLTSEYGDTNKYLFAMDSHTIIESVLMRYEHGNTVCISTQAGCRMGCRFCASTENGFFRNLTAGEMCAQVYRIQRETGQRIDNVVLMGCGEPLDNYCNTVRFIGLITHPKGIGQRHITVSTCGLAPQIIRLAELKMQLTLAVSLHAPDDEIRRSIMPVAFKHSLSDIIDACRTYICYTGRRISFEYALIPGVNDETGHALMLSCLLKGLLCHVNLIRINAKSSNSKQRQSDEKDYQKKAAIFVKILVRNHIPVSIRRSLGCDIQAACGQLRAKYINEA